MLLFDPSISVFSVEKDHGQNDVFVPQSYRKESSGREREGKRSEREEGRRRTIPHEYTKDQGVISRKGHIKG